MAYSKTNWVNNTTPINETNLNKIEQGIYDNSLVVDAVKNTLNPTDTETYKTAELTEGQITDVIGVKDIIIKGQTEQDGTPTPSAPVDVNVVSGDNTIKISNSNNTLSQSFPISLGSLELCRIGDYQDYIYKKDDKWWKHKEIDKKELSINNWKIDDVVNGIYQYSFPSEVKVNTKSADPLVLSTYYKGVPFNHGNIASWEVDNAIVTVASTGKDIRIMTSKQTNLDDFKAFIKNKDLGIRAVLPSAVEEQITDTTLITQLEAIYNAPLYEQTNITQTNNDLPMVLDITACKDNIKGIKAFIRK